MSKQGGISLHCIVYRRVGYGIRAMLLGVLLTLPWSAVTELAQDAGQEEALGESGKAGSRAAWPAISEAKSPDETGGPGSTSQLMGMVAGVVVDPNGEPVEGADLYLGDYQRYFPEFTGELLPRAWPVGKAPEVSNRAFRWTRRTRTDAAGCFRMPLEPGPELKKGRYEYKFVLDGQTWQTDPENLLQTGFYRNSVLHVGAEP